VGQQQAILGLITPIRNLTVAERLKLPPSVEAKNAAVATKVDVINEILALDLYVDDISAPGFRDEAADVKNVFKTFKEIREDGLAAEVLAGLHDPVILNSSTTPTASTITDADEAAYYSAGVTALENAASMLRLVEARAQSQRNIVVLSESRISEIVNYIQQAKSRLSVIAVHLAESRHDVSVARSLLTEEQLRIDALNEHRQMVLEKHVPYLAFYRPRVVDQLQNTPVHALNPAMLEPVIPACLSRKDETPDELGQVMDILSEAPVKWFSAGKKLLDELSSIEQQAKLLEHAKNRATNYNLYNQFKLSTGYAGLSIQNNIFSSMTAMYNVVNNYRQQTATMDLAGIRQNSWRKNKDAVKKQVSMADIIDGKHGSASLSSKAGKILDDIESISNCLYHSFSEVPASIRLDWAERLSQFDNSVNLRDLYALPRWQEIDYLSRQEMQRFADWLHNIIDTKDNDAVAVINDTIRICLLLASHAPVNRIISGSIKDATTVKVGDTVDITVDPSVIKVGMNVLVYVQNKPVITAIVNNFNGGYTSAKIVKTSSPSISLAKGAKVQFSKSIHYV